MTEQTTVRLIDTEIRKQDDGMYQVVATYSNGKVKTWSDFSTSKEAVECVDAVEFMSAKVR